MERTDIIEIFSRAVTMLEDLGHEASVYEKYSGRGMYGATCEGIMTDASGILVGFCICDSAKSWGEDSGQEFDDDSLVDILPTRMDNMGMDFIYY